MHEIVNFFTEIEIKYTDQTLHSFPGPASLPRQLTAPIQWQQGAQGALPVELSPGDHQATLDPLMTVLSACVEILKPNLSPHKLPQVDSSSSSQNPPNLKLREIKFSKAKTCLATKTSMCERHCAKQTHNYVKYLLLMNHSQRSTCFKVIIQGDFLAKKHDYPTLVLCFLSPPLKTHQFMEAFVSKPLGRFWIEHLSVLFLFLTSPAGK